MNIFNLPCELVSYFCDSSIIVDVLDDESYMLGFEPSTITDKQLINDLHKIIGYNVTTLTQINFSQNLELVEFHRVGKEHEEDFIDRVK